MIKFMRFKRSTGDVVWFPVEDVEQITQFDSCVRVWVVGRTLGGEDFEEMLDPV